MVFLRLESWANSIVGYDVEVEVSRLGVSAVTGERGWVCELDEDQGEDRKTSEIGKKGVAVGAGVGAGARLRPTS